MLTSSFPSSISFRFKYIITYYIYKKTNDTFLKAEKQQRAKKVVSDSPRLEDFAIGLVFFVLNLPDGQVLFFGEIQITEGLLSILPIKKGFGASWNDLWASTCYLQLARMAGCKTDFLCTLNRLIISHFRPLVLSYKYSPYQFEGLKGTWQTNIKEKGEKQKTKIKKLYCCKRTADVIHRVKYDLSLICFVGKGTVQRGNAASINVRQAALCALGLGEAYKLIPQTSY